MIIKIVTCNLCFVCFRLKTKLDRGGVFQEFVDALQQLTNPEMLFKVKIYLLILAVFDIY